jgi:hypothetical protein
MSDLQRDIEMKEPTERPDDNMVHLRLPRDLRAAIERQAEQECRTLSGQLRWLLACGLEARAQPQRGVRT